jgi:excisionase family DNA binding protein
LIDSGVRKKRPIFGTESIRKLTDYVTTAEAAENLGVSQNTMRGWARDGKIPMHWNLANGYGLFPRSDLQAFLKRIERPARPH